jgi:hypothetical protein
MGHLPTDVAPDVRARSFVIEADIVTEAGREGVLIAHGDATCGYTLFVLADYAAPFEFTGVLRKVTVTMDADQAVDGTGMGEAEMARQ